MYHPDLLNKESTFLLHSIVLCQFLIIHHHFKYTMTLQKKCLGFKQFLDFHSLTILLMILLLLNSKKFLVVSYFFSKCICQKLLKNQIQIPVVLPNAFLRLTAILAFFLSASIASRFYISIFS